MKRSRNDIKRSGQRSAQLELTRLAALLVGTALASSHAAAETASPGIDPRQLERLDLSQQSSDRPRQTATRKPQFDAAPAADASPITTLRDVTVTGVRSIPAQSIAETYRPYLGRQVSTADLVKIADAINALYRQAGYYLSRAIVPPQDVKGGHVRIQVIEGRLAEVSVEGNDAEKFGAPALLAGLTAEMPARMQTLDRKLALLADRPGLQVADTAIDEIRPLSGEFRLVVRLKTWRIYLSNNLDNFGSKAVGPWQSFSTVAFNSYGLPGDVLTANFSSSPNDVRELAVGRISYDAPIGDGFKIGATALHSEVRPGDERRDYGVITRSDFAELRGSFAPLQSQSSAVVVTAAFDAIESRENDVFGTFYRDRIRTANLMVDVRLQDDFGGTNYLTVLGKRGISGLGATQYGDGMSSRYDADPNVSIVDAWFTRYQTLTDTLSLKMSVAGQLSTGPLLNWQQFYLGGASFGRGYGSGEISGDNGIGGTFEVRFDGKTPWSVLPSYQLYGFVDGGAVWNSGYRIGDGLELASVGGGIRLNLPQSFRADLGFAVPFGYRSPDNEARGVRFLLTVSNSLKLCPGSAGWNCS